MFEPRWVGRLRDTLTAIPDLDLSEASVDDLRELICGVQAGIDRLHCLQAQAVAAFAGRDGHRLDGCSSVGAWLRRELRLSGAESRRLRRAGPVLDELPDVAAAVQAGVIRPSHVEVFATGVKRLGPATVRDHQDILLPVAKACDPADLQTAIDRLRDTLDPDAADRDWIQAQEKYDLNLHRVGNGWTVTGYLDPDTGTKLRHVLDSVAAPAGENDERPIAQRRVQGLNAVLSSILDAGQLPSDKGLRPHLTVLVEYQTLKQAVAKNQPAPDDASADTTVTPITPSTTDTPNAPAGDDEMTADGMAAPAFLKGYGTIGRGLLARLACDAAVTVVLTDTTDAAGRSPYRHVLDVGRTQRLATAKQRLAVLIQQGYRCANPACPNTHLEIHHITSWLHGGPTDLHNLVGLCPACHHLLHTGLLTCRRNRDGTLVFTTANGAPIPHRRQHLLDQTQRRIA